MAFAMAALTWFSRRGDRSSREADVAGMRESFLRRLGKEPNAGDLAAAWDLAVGFLLRTSRTEPPDDVYRLTALVIRSIDPRRRPDALRGMEADMRALVTESRGDSLAGWILDHAREAWALDRPS